MEKLYPMTFRPNLHELVWGGHKLQALKGLPQDGRRLGESWEISDVATSESVVAEGPLQGQTLRELVAHYGPSLLGKHVFESDGREFPLLVKFIDAQDDLSIQVHPGDALARERHGKLGKTEMWYVMDAEPGATLLAGFKQRITRKEYRRRVADGTIVDALARHEVHPGDVFFIPAGRVHALGKGLMVAEIQQTSDCTYRIYDYDRVDADGRKRQLHTAEAMDAIDFSGIKTTAATRYVARRNQTVTLADCPYFTTRLIDFDTPMRKNLEETDTFVLYLCVDGLAAVKSMETIVPMHVGECVLVPAVADSVELFCEGPAKLLEVTIDTTDWHDAPNRDNDWVAQFVGSMNN
jgi:mannose-6-phosphate isomerase